MPNDFVFSGVCSGCNGASDECSNGGDHGARRAGRRWGERSGTGIGGIRRRWKGGNGIGWPYSNQIEVHENVVWEDDSESYNAC